MCSIICKNNKGISLVESIVAVLLLTIGVLAILSMQPTALKTSSRADYLGHAVMLLNREFMIQEAWIMNPCNAVSVGTVNRTAVYSSENTATRNGDPSFNITIVTSVVTGQANTWNVTITITWPPVNSVGITDNMIVTRQEAFRFGCV